MIEEFSYEGSWFQPVFSTQNTGGNWQIAVLNYDYRQGIDMIDKLEIHQKTDETFILERGTAVLMTAGIDATQDCFHCTNLKRGKIYNIPKGIWHNIVMWEGSSVYIVENRDTHINDVKYQSLEDTEKKKLQVIIKEILP